LGGVPQGQGLFDFNSSTIPVIEASKLAQLAAALKAPLNATANFAIIGHADSTGSDSYNCLLSQKRTRTVAQRLAALGISRKRILTIGAGEYVLRNLADGKADENRRVGFARLKTRHGSIIHRLSKLCSE
jgi:outer membrane protein OmpA-like peptidoglycan-associated protein